MQPFQLHGNALVCNGEIYGFEKFRNKNNNFDYIYVGTAAEAVQDDSGWIPAIPNADGAYTYILEIPSLDNEIRIATYSARKKMWYDRTMFIDSVSLNTKGGD